MKPRSPVLLSILRAYAEMRGYWHQYRQSPAFKRSEKLSTELLSEYRQQWRELKQQTKPTT